jgi:hypothetical protein
MDNFRNAYWDNKVAARSVLVDLEDGLRGETLISAESSSDEFARNGIVVFISSHFTEFLHWTTYLRVDDRELLLCYYLVGNTQNTLAKMFGLSQTQISSTLRYIVRALCFWMYCEGEITQEKLERILVPAGLEDVDLESRNQHFKLSELVMLYYKTRSFQAVANLLDGIHRPTIKRAISHAYHVLLMSEVAEEIMLGAWLERLMYRVNPTATGLTQKYQNKSADIFRSDPDGIGDFHITVESPVFEHVFWATNNENESQEGRHGY